MPATRKVRAVRVAPSDAVVRRGTNGAVYMQSGVPLGPYQTRITDSLDHWAAHAPDRTFLAQRDDSVAAGLPPSREASADRRSLGEGGQARVDTTRGWRRLNYGDALTRVRRIAQALLDRKLSLDRPIVILSGNGIEHGLLALAAMYVGVPYAPIAPAYSLQATEYTALQRIFERVEPALVFTENSGAYERALRSVLTNRVELVVSGSPGRLLSTPFSELEGARDTAAVDEAKQHVTGETIAKVLFTSGSTGRPKGVINTQRMLCSNQEMIRSVLTFLADEPPVICDWSPWNHTAGGNHNFGLVLRNGGTLYIDEGKPTPALFAATLRNLREIPCTAHFAVPRLYEMLMPHLRSDAVLRRTFFSRVQLLFYAAAGLGQRFWDELRDVALEACGEEIMIMTGFGATETAPFAFTTATLNAFAGLVGLPAPGIEVKLTPVESKMEARVRGPNITPGYWRDAALTAAAFDEEGFYRLGDAMDFADPIDPRNGLVFNGRLAEDFKLSTATWVSVGPLRAKILAQAGGLAQDVVIAGHDREYVTALVFPNLQMCRDVLGAGADTPARAVLSHPVIVRRFSEVFTTLAAVSTGSSTFVARAIVLEDPPSMDAREVTDKGSINQKAVLAHRAALVDELYSASPSPHVLIAGQPAETAAPLR
jgi:feruloyl-CoA synthase